MRGKTSAVLAFRGKHAPQQRAKFLLHDRPGVWCDVGEDEPAWLHCMNSYKHLGVVFTANRSWDLEIAQRTGSAGSSFALLARPRNKYLPVDVRLRLFKALICTKLFFGMGAWPILPPKLMDKLQTTLVKMLRRALRLGAGADGKLTNAEVLAKAGMGSMRSHVALERLRFAQQLFRHAPVFVQHLLHLERARVSDSWVEGLSFDIQWLAELDAAIPVDWAKDFTDFIDRAQQHNLRPSWKSTLHRAWRFHLQQERMMLTVHADHQELFAILRDHGACFDPDVDSRLQATTAHRCHCGQSFSSGQGLAVHKRRAHGEFALEHGMLNGATCPACLTFLWTTQRLQQHLAYAPRSGLPNPCYQQPLEAGYQVQYEPVNELRSQQGINRCDALRAFGPPLPFAQQAQRRLDALDLAIASVQDEHLIRLPVLSILPSRSCSLWPS